MREYASHDTPQLWCHGSLLQLKDWRCADTNRCLFYRHCFNLRTNLLKKNWLDFWLCHIYWARVLFLLFVFFHKYPPVGLHNSRKDDCFFLFSMTSQSKLGCIHGHVINEKMVLVIRKLLKCHIWHFSLIKKNSTNAFCDGKICLLCDAWLFKIQFNYNDKMPNKILIGCWILSVNVRRRLVYWVPLCLHVFSTMCSMFNCITVGWCMQRHEHVMYLKRNKSSHCALFLICQCHCSHRKKAVPKFWPYLNSESLTELVMSK